MRRRHFLKLAASAAALPAARWFGPAPAAAACPGPKDPRYLFVVTAWGGASVHESFLPTLESEVSTPELARELACYPERQVAQPPGSELRCVKRLTGLRWLDVDYDLTTFLERHGQHLAVVTQTASSVVHLTAQHRAVTGAGINRGRTLMEALADQRGRGLLLPNIAMATDGFVQHGEDPDLPPEARAQLVSNPRFFPLLTDAIEHLSAGVPRDELRRARKTRRALEAASDFARDFANSPERKHYLRLQGDLVPRVEAADLTSRLVAVSPEVADPKLPAEELIRLLEHLPSFAQDELEAQAALAYLLVRYGITCSVTLGMDNRGVAGLGKMVSPPLAFDFAHSFHRSAQNHCWRRLMKVVDGLIGLLGSQPLDPADPARGSLWDKSVIYIATDFGRTKRRPVGAEEFPSGHHVNNGSLVISPLVRGGRVYGGVDHDRMMTYGFDPATGEPRPGWDDGRQAPAVQMNEGHVYSLVAGALGLEFEGRHAMKAALRC